MTKSAVVYVTRTGHSRALAEAVAARLGAKAHEIVDLVPRKGSLRYFWAGGQASMGRASRIKDPEVDLADAESVVLVEPVWAGSVCPPLRTWLRAHAAELSGKKIALLVSCLGSEAEPLRAKFEAEFFPLAAFARVLEKDSRAEKDAAIDALCGAMLR
jgi:menaquinone-dependent protoporphyrinogen IX oxidase